MYVYCATNVSMPGLVKIGMTNDVPSRRMSQLSNLTAVPTPFLCTWYASSYSPARDEARLHNVLKDKRVSSKREFFRCTPEFAQSAALSIGLKVNFPGQTGSVDRKHTLGQSNSEWKAAGIVLLFMLVTAPYYLQKSLLYQFGALVVAAVIGAIAKIYFEWEE